ncbi:thiopeptide-type bacteriocin biosynthesis protein [Nonomuraea sp. CA-143628]|uniref:thiopeptide-type bacteriocin biosynthesis protein n=1 Tax=Nonomuraea sp. CA-143628 TaxID=3239997 RepID=UPI003D902E52
MHWRAGSCPFRSTLTASENDSGRQHQDAAPDHPPGGRQPPQRDRSQRDVGRPRARRSSSSRTTPTPGRLEALADTIRPLVAAPIGPADPEGPCAFAAPWADAFRHAGRLLTEASTAGHLDRGVRHILTHLVIFHWNRLGLSATTQAILSRAAREALLPGDQL